MKASEFIQIIQTLQAMIEALQGQISNLEGRLAYLEANHQPWTPMPVRVWQTPDTTGTEYKDGIVYYRNYSPTTGDVSTVSMPVPRGTIVAGATNGHEGNG